MLINNNIGNLSKPFVRFFDFVRRDINKILLNMVLVVGSVLTGAAIIWMIGLGFDAFRRSDFDLTPPYLIGFVLLVVVLQTLRFSSYFIQEWMQQRVINEIRRKMYAHLLDLASPFKDKSSSGDLLTRLGQDVVRVSEFVVLMPAKLFSYAVTLLLYIALLLYIDVWLTISATIIVPLIYIHQRVFVIKVRDSAQSFLTNQGRMTAFEEESLRNIQGISTFSANETMLKKFDNVFSVFRRAAMRNLMLNNAFVVSFELLVAVSAVLLVALGVYRIGQGVLTVGGLLNFLLYLGYLSVPLRALANIPIESQVLAVASERVARILDEIPLVKEKEITRNIFEVRGEITLKDVCFSYQKSMPIFKYLNIKIRSGEHVAIMGESGVGKSTIARLLLRIYDPDNGKVLVDGIDVRNITLQTLRSHVAVVWQEPFFIDDTIYENLRLCKEGVSDKEIRDALHKSGASEFIEKLPDGYNSHLGNQGAILSSGQKQRIAIAQVFLKQASVLILDEATSALDSDSEFIINNAIENMPKNCTVIIITHRISTAYNVNRIIYLNPDRTVTTGTFHDLKSSHKDFRRILNYQRVMSESA